MKNQSHLGVVFKIFSSMGDRLGMSKIIPITLFLSLSACTTMAPVSYDERCSMRNMVLGGITETESSSSSVSYVSGANGPILIPTETSSAGEQVHCSVPQTEEQKCMAKLLREGAEPKAEWNEGEGGRRVVRVFGYLLIIPGMIANAVQDSKRNEVVKNYKEWVAKNSDRCSSSVAKGNTTSSREPASR